MARVRFGVVLVVPPPVGLEVDGLRRGFGDPALGRLPPHITLVPPVNVPVAEIPGTLAVLRAAAAEASPLDLVLGPLRTFGTDEGVVYLAVGGADLESGALHRLRDRCRTGPLARPDEHEFVPHVTLATGVAPDRVDTLLAAADGYRDVVVRVERLHLLLNRPEPPHGWVAVADVSLAPAIVVGRGGLPVELTPSELVDPEAQSALDGLVPIDAEAGSEELDPPGVQALVVAARREGPVTGVAQGWTAGPVAHLVSVQVADPDDGTDAHLRAAWWSAAADRGAS